MEMNGVSNGNLSSSLAVRERKAKGFCSWCDNRPVPGKQLCRKHLQKARENQERLVQSNKKQEKKAKKVRIAVASSSALGKSSPERAKAPLLKERSDLKLMEKADHTGDEQKLVALASLIGLGRAEQIIHNERVQMMKAFA